jgi:hypothetical protein
LNRAESLERLCKTESTVILGGSRHGLEAGKGEQAIGRANIVEVQCRTAIRVCVGGIILCQDPEKGV